MIRLKDIAERVDVSVMTVSRVMRDTPNIAPATRRRVLRVARELGYVPDAAARGLRLQNTHLLGLVLPALGDPAWAAIASALEAVWAPSGYDLAMACSHQDEESEEARIARLMGRRVEGLFVAPLARAQKIGGVYRQLREQGIRVVVLGPRPEHLGGFPAVTVNDRAGMALAVAHLLGLGHQRIAFLAGPEYSSLAGPRLEGYRAALASRQIPVREELIVPAGATVEDGAVAARRLLERKVEFTAIMAFSDPLAVGALRELTAAGLEVPRQISILGYANHPCSEFSSRPLSTVDTDIEAQARAAARVMSDLIAGERGRDQRVEPRLICRDSCAPVRPATAS
ncbi:MAG: LacI family DNA-binding transcriptional regulator [Verrucomicrobiales bacterium]|nr:LacI family DNA-binding transcriptional regulator [Verrucomicrobiales bacterium]